MRKIFKANSIRTEMVCLTLCLALIPMLIMQGVFRYFFYSYANDKAISAYDDYFERVSTKLDETIFSIIQTSNTLFLNEDFQNEYKEHIKNPLFLQRYLVDSKLMKFDSLTEIIDGAYFVDINDISDIYYNMRSSGRENIDSLQDDFYSIMSNDGHPYRMVFQALSDTDGVLKNQMLMIRKITSLENVFMDLGYGILVFDRTYLTELLNMYYAVEGTVSFIVNENDIILASSDSINDGKKITDIIQKESADNAIYNNLKCLYRSQESNDIGWRIVSVIPETMLYGEADNLQAIMLAAIALLVFLLVFMFLFFNMRLTIPLQKLSKAFQSVASGNLETQLTLGGHDEITSIAAGFNSMVTDVRNLNSRVLDTQRKLFETEINKARYELNGLLTQINSHFLYNTLNSICCLIQLNKTNEAVSGIMLLIDYLRYAAQNKQYTRLDEELRYLKNYTSIQNMRWNGRFMLLFDVDEQVMDAYVLRLLLQPIVENAIIHGFDSQKGRIIIKVIVKRVENRLLIRILDTGIGIQEEKLAQLQEMMQMDEQKYKKTDGKSYSIGLRNIVRRLHVYYGDNASVTVKSRNGIGTVISIMIPFKRGEKDETFD